MRESGPTASRMSKYMATLHKNEYDFNLIKIPLIFALVYIPGWSTITGQDIFKASDESRPIV